MIGVVACSKRKLPRPAPAGDLYTGRTFRAASELLRAMGAERLVILSAEHGPVDASTVLAPYERTLVGARRAEIAAWAADAAPKLCAMLGDGPALAIVPESYALALKGLPTVTRLFAGLPQGRLFSAIAAALAERQPTTASAMSNEGVQ